mgnify:CR=1 FL=1
MSDTLLMWRKFFGFGDAIFVNVSSPHFPYMITSSIWGDITMLVTSLTNHPNSKRYAKSPHIEPNYYTHNALGYPNVCYTLLSSNECWLGHIISPHIFGGMSST